MKIIKKSFIVFLGILFVLGALELFIRIFYSTEKFRTLNTKSKIESIKTFNILVLGNSHTYGAGVGTDQAYASVLERFFEAEQKNINYKVNVFNGGLLGANTHVIYQNLDHLIATANPQLAIIMAGEPNFWNKNGFGEFLAQSYGVGQSFWSTIVLKLSNISKVVKWFMHISNMSFESSRFDLAEDLKNEILVYKEITASEDNYRKIIRDEKLNWDILKSIEKYIELNKSKPNRDIWRPTLYLHARNLLYLKKDFSLVISLIQESIQFDKNIFDVYSYMLLDEIKVFQNLNSEQTEQLNKISNDLISSKLFPGRDSVEKCILYTLHSRRDIIIGRDEEAFLKECKAFFSAYAIPAVALNNYYIKKNNFDQAAQALIDVMNVNPFSRREQVKIAFISIPIDKRANVNLQNQVVELVRSTSQKYPSEAFMFEVEQDEKIYEWIKWDLKNIANKLNESETPLVIQNYHWIRYLTTPKLNNCLEEAAHEMNVPFINTNATFQEIAEKSGDIESYFVQVFGAKDSHPSEKGHRLIAYIIYKDLVEKKLLPPELTTLDPEKILIMQ